MAMIRETLLADHADIPTFAREVGVTEGTVRLWFRTEGLPAVRFGRKLYLHLPTARAWVTKHKYQAQARAQHRGAQINAL